MVALNKEPLREILSSLDPKGSQCKGIKASELELGRKESLSFQLRTNEDSSLFFAVI
jgi:hypothetical protein